ncbi:MAG: glutamate racemase [gamma proteobacterium symbiont of Bathyaustriella thionipta]|nr:glutamate racemase [gamma proteobacterium symbiont of Bathyaustriella thionipta]MCU7948818.1 glutamate racemase [gamma proteobacterium symbiont of Bathyaustriella thionipta]MCU7954371.1 glutamate racemase [gamma proteobacterium symbiont of Bathyaustriella thionipta]MCU7955276.1 glutamate racemase [gamma proteobacterium symbiont of Bathyaustriella thionipta]MCU7966627.1 glutamate racemase [gamma proteobacterium symbiont of Bathyaustriella thionipta]
MKNNQPIGIFDSGVGGLSVLQHIHQLLPHEHILYVADSGHAPYGCKDDTFVEQRSRVITEHLIKQGAKAIVIACNTATASIIETFRDQYGIPFIGVEPGIKPAIAISKNANIGIMATTATLSSTRYSELTQRFGDNVNLHNQACPGLADLVEAGLLDAPETIQLLQNYLQALKEKNVDTIVLGCTHYSFLSTQIRQIVGRSTQLIDTSYAIAEQLARVLEQENLTNQSRHGSIEYFTTGSIDNTQAAISSLLGYKVAISCL